MPKIYISHVREDTSYAAKALYLALTNHYGRKFIYPKLDTTHVGKVLSKQVDQMAAKCDIMLVLIGDRFLQPGSGSRSSVSRLGGLVETAIKSAVRCKMPILAVLIGDVEMPTEDLLPVERMELASNVPVRFRPEGHFREDLEKLIERIDDTAPKKLSGLLSWFR